MSKMNDEVVVGTRVILNSGGPYMTVEAIEGKKAHCVWFDSTIAHRDSFDVALIRIPDEEVFLTAGRRRSADLDDYF